MTQGTIFDELPLFKIIKPIRLIELFAGYGSQSLALEYLNVNFEHYKISEWNYKSFKAYKDIHMTNDIVDYSKSLSEEDIIDFLNKKVISSNWNEPMELNQIQRLDEDKLREIYNNFIATHNLGSVTQIKGSDLEINDIDKYDYVMTYSFPCQDLSNAGVGKGMEKGSGTRSGLLWEVERILNELENKPQVLIMENVPLVHGKKNLTPFNNWLIALQKLGYTNYFKDLNAKDYGIPQSRNRCFMVSILGDYNYEFPEKQKLELRLKDLLEDKVDDKYYLSQKMVDYITSPGSGNYVAPISFNGDVACSIVTSPGSHRAGIDNYVKEPIKIYDSYNHKDVDMMGTIPATYGKVGHGCVVKEPICLNSKVNGKQPSLQDRVYDSNGISTAITTSFAPAYKIQQVGNLYSDTDTFKNKSCGRIYSSNGLSPTLNTCGVGNHLPIIETPIKQKDCTKEIGTITENGNTYVFRRLTPKERWRLMGVKDNDSQKLSDSNSTLYHLAGDSIVVNVLIALFNQMI